MAKTKTKTSAEVIQQTHDLIFDKAIVDLQARQKTLLDQRELIRNKSQELCNKITKVCHQEAGKQIVVGLKRPKVSGGEFRRHLLDSNASSTEVFARVNVKIPKQMRPVMNEIRELNRLEDLLWTEIVQIRNWIAASEKTKARRAVSAKLVAHLEATPEGKVLIQQLYERIKEGIQAISTVASTTT